MRFAWLIPLLFATPALAAPSAGKLITLDADLDGDGKPETITLDKDGTIMAGLGEIKPQYDEAEGPKHSKLEVIPLGGKRMGIYLITEQEEGEDPPDRHQVFLYKPGKHRTLPYCEADGTYTAMMQGDVLELEFETPQGQRHLWARGYYNPLPIGD